jgi:GNAT superfamily N-acetyltransferase
MISIEESTIEELYKFERNIPEFQNYSDLEELKSRLSDTGHIIKAVEDAEILGFTAGYPINSITYYLWISGVFPHYRKRGVAKDLLDYLEKMVREEGFQIMRVKSMNQFKAMIHFLINNDYLISGYEDNGNSWKSKIIFEKNLNG